MLTSERLTISTKRTVSSIVKKERKVRMRVKKFKSKVTTPYISLRLRSKIDSLTMVTEAHRSIDLRFKSSTMVKKTMSLREKKNSTRP